MGTGEKLALEHPTRQATKSGECTRPMIRCPYYTFPCLRSLRSRIAFHVYQSSLFVISIAGLKTAKDLKIVREELIHKPSSKSFENEVPSVLHP